MRQALAYFFEKQGFEVVAVPSITDAKHALERPEKWDLVISDYHLPDGSGWELCCWIRQQARSAPPFLLISGGLAAAALASEVDFLAKPFSVEELAGRVDTLLDKPRQ